MHRWDEVRDANDARTREHGAADPADALERGFSLMRVARQLSGNARPARDDVRDIWRTLVRCTRDHHRP